MPGPGEMSGTIAEREAELAALQSAFDEYITSSRELEEELDAELSKMQEKLGESTAANAALSGQLENIAPQLHSLEKALEDIKQKYDEEAKLRRQAEMAQDDAEARLRESEGALLKVKEDADVACEELAFKEEELEEMRLELEVEKERNRVQVDEMRADMELEMRKLSVSEDKDNDDDDDDDNDDNDDRGGEPSAGGGDDSQMTMTVTTTTEAGEMTGDESRDDDYVKRLEDELELVTEQLIETEQRLSETEEELAMVEEERANMAVTSSGVRDAMMSSASSSSSIAPSKDDDNSAAAAALLLQKENEALLEEGQNLKEELELTKEELVLTQEELAAAEEDAQRASNSLQTAQSLLRQETAKLKEQCQAAEASAKSAEVEVETMEKSLEASAIDNNELQEQIENLNKALDNAKADHAAVMEELDAVNERFDAVRQEAESVGRDAATAAIKNELESVHAQKVDSLKKELDASKKESQKLQQQLDEAEMQVAATQGLTESDAKVTSEMVEKLQKQLLRSKDSVAKKDDEITQLKTALETRVAKAEDDVSRLEKELSSTKGKLAEAEAHLIVSRLDKERALAQMSAAKTAAAASQKQQTDMTTTEEERLEQQKADEEEDTIQELQKKNEELKDQHRMSEVRVKRLEADVKSLQSQLFAGDTPVVTSLSRLSTMSSPSNKGKGAQNDDVRDTGEEKVEAVIETRDVSLISDHLRKVDENLARQRVYNSQLLGKILSLQGNIQVCCRVRPMARKEIERGQKSVVESLSEAEVGCRDNRTNKWKSFGFDKVWGPDQSQQAVFQDVEPLALSVVDGYNACIFAYGQTGSGKTYTMEGADSPSQHGISYRTIQKIFNLLNLRAQQQKAAATFMRESSDPQGGDNNNNNISDDGAFEFSLTVGMLEIYNDEVYDLLGDLSSNGATVADKKRNAKESGTKATLDIRRNADDVIEVPNLTKEPVKSVEDMMTLLRRGNASRATAATDLNEHSSRSHMVLVVDVTSGIAGKPGNKGSLFLVDLAGSERVRKSKVEGEHLKEAGHINKSLSALGNVMEALDRKAKHVPYRDSKLTYLLQDALGGNSRTMMVVAVCPMDTAFDESIHALQFATRVRRIQIGAAQRNSTSRNLEETVKNLTSEMKMLSKAKEKSEMQLHSLKRDNSRIQERLQHISEARKTSQAENRTLEVLRKNNTEMANRWQKEKSMREKQVAELEKKETELKTLQNQQAKNKREIDTLTLRLKEKETSLERATHDLRKAKEASSAANIRLRTSQIIGSRGTGRTPAKPVRPTTSSSLASSSPRAGGGGAAAASPRAGGATVASPSAAKTNGAARTPKVAENVDASKVREEVLELLKKYDTTKVGRIDIIMERFKGKENLLLDKMKERYEGDVTAQTSLKTRNEMALERHKERMKKKNENKK